MELEIKTILTGYRIENIYVMNGEEIEFIIQISTN